MTAEDQNQSLHNNGDIYSKSLWELIQMMQISQRRLFACDCVEHVLHIYQEAFPDDTTVQEVIDLSRRFARGKAVYDELFTAKINLNSVPDRMEYARYVVRAATVAAWRPEPDWATKVGTWEGAGAAWEAAVAAQKAVSTKHKSVEHEAIEEAWQRQRAIEILSAGNHTEPQA
jgi:hypothetical protein